MYFNNENVSQFCKPLLCYIQLQTEQLLHILSLLEINKQSDYSAPQNNFVLHAQLDLYNLEQTKKLRNSKTKIHVITISSNEHE